MIQCSTRLCTFRLPIWMAKEACRTVEDGDKRRTDSKLSEGKCPALSLPIGQWHANALKTPERGGDPDHKNAKLHILMYEKGWHPTRRIIITVLHAINLELLSHIQKQSDEEKYPTLSLPRNRCEIDDFRDTAGVVTRLMRGVTSPPYEAYTQNEKQRERL